MLAFGIITVFLTGFVLVFYGYLARHQDRDVSFFLSVEIIFMIMNLCTNASESAVVLAWLYFFAALAFLGLGFAVSVQDTLGFYKSIGPWFKGVFTNTQQVGWDLLSFCIAPAGVALYFVKHREDRYFADRCGKLGLWGLLCWLLLLWLILGAI